MFKFLFSHIKFDRGPKAIFSALSAISIMNATNDRKVYIQTKLAEDILYDMWFTIAEKLFNKVADITELDEEQRNALRTVALRPNDFRVIIN